jgi:hypothetical protein
MKFQLPEETARSIDEQAATFIDALAPEPENPKDPKGTFRPNYLKSVVSIASLELPTGSINPTFGSDDHEVARFFPEFNPAIGLSETRYDLFINLCRQLYETAQLNLTVSETFVVDRCFEWLRQRHLEITRLGLTDFVFAECARHVITLDVWLPLIGLEVEKELELGSVILKSIRQADWRRWVSDWHTRHTGEISRLRQFLLDVETDCLTVAVCRTIAEPIKAVEIAIEKTEEALDVLRYFSPSNHYPSTPAFCSIAGSEPVSRPKHLILQNGYLASAGITLNTLRARHPWRIDESLMGKMRGMGFDTLASLLKKSASDRTELQNDFVKALAIYSKSSIAQNLTDKLLYAVLTMESLLLKDQSESLQKHIGERMAFMTGNSLKARIAIIDNYKKAYALRSLAVHHGRQVKQEELEVLEQFIPGTWFTLKWIVAKFDQFNTKQEMIEHIDDIKFS